MKHEKKTRHSASEDPAVVAATGVAGSVPSSVYVTSAGAPIDFHSAEFNRIDDLTDCTGNVRSFEPLGDIVTADMRHQMERRRDRQNADACTNMETVPLKGDERRDVRPQTPEEMPPLTIVSNGRTLIIDTDARRAGECSTRLGAQGLECTVVLTTAGPKDSPSPRLSFWGPLRADNLSVSGAFGGFDAAATVNGDRKPLAEWLGDKNLSFDLVLDLQSKPSYAGELLPMGYYCARAGPLGS